MIKILIPSLDRPSQLDLLLRSLFRYWDWQQIQIKVIYKYSNKDYEKGYYKVFERYWHVLPELEYNFGEQVKNNINCSIPTTVGFMTDDCVVFRNPGVVPSDIKDIFNDNVHSFSLRLGENTIVQNYLTGELQPNIISKREIYKDIFTYKWKLQPRFSNYGYMFSFDGHFYSKEWLLKAFTLCPNGELPRAIEHQFNTSDTLRDYSAGLMSICKTSSLFVNSINMVQEAGPLAGSRYSYSPSLLNEKWLSGYEIDLESFDNLDIISSHEEFPLKFKRTT